MTVSERLVEHACVYRLTVPPIAARLLAIHPQRARRLLESVVRTGSLRRFRFQDATYFSAERRALSDRAVRTAFGVSWFCHMEKTPVALLPPAALVEIIGPVAAELGFSNPLPVPAYLNRATRRLSVFVLGPEGVDTTVDCRVRRHIERFIRKRWFRPYLALIAAGHGELTLLLPGATERSAITLTLNDAPAVLSPADGIVLPVQVSPLVTLSADAGEDKSPTGAFVHER
jgi:hypothetical protein